MGRAREGLVDGFFVGNVQAGIGVVEFHIKADTLTFPAL
jgi:hypothetical protein